MMLKIDHRKELKQLYQASKSSPVIIDVPPLNYLMIDGVGRPEKQEFQDAISSVYPLAYTLKFMIRAERDIDYHVMPLQVLWRVKRETKDFEWTVMLMQPEAISPERYAEALGRVRAKGGAPLLERVRYETLEEGRCVQYLYQGPYPGMDAAFDKMQAYAVANGYTIPRHNTHDIYLNDSRKTKPENLRTIMRAGVIDK